jgi:transcriptional regulator with XRE-family HTH domain
MKRFTQRQLIEELSASLKLQGQTGIGVSYLSKIETEQFGPPSNVVIAHLSELLGAHPDELFCLAGRLPPKIAEKLSKNRAATEFLTFAIDRLTESDWQELLALTQKRFPMIAH